MTKLTSFTSSSGNRVWCATWQNATGSQTIVCDTMLEALESIEASRTGIFPNRIPRLQAMVVYVVKEGDHGRLTTVCLGRGYNRLAAWRLVNYWVLLEDCKFAWSQSEKGRIWFSRYSTEAYIEAEI